MTSLLKVALCLAKLKLNGDTKCMITNFKVGNIMNRLAVGWSARGQRPVCTKHLKASIKRVGHFTIVHL